MDEDRAVDNSSWDGNAAMGACSSASDYRSICAGEKTVGDPDERQHWALPHHYLGKGPNASGVRNARSRLSQTQGLSNKQAAESHLEAHMREINPEASLPRDGLVRSAAPTSYEVRTEGDGATLFGHFARFNEWNEIDSFFEGRFLERVVPGAFARTFEEDRERMKVTYNHGRSPYGDLVLGPIRELREEDAGPYYEVPMFPSVPDLLIDGLRAGVYGASYRFRVRAEELVKRPERSDYNPDGLPERTITDAQVGEFGPVTFPADVGATAGVRSLTDEFLTTAQLEEFRALAQIVRKPHEGEEKTGTTPPPPGQVSARHRKRIDYLQRRNEPWRL